MPSFKRKTYGKVKPVKAAKIEPPKKPSLLLINGHFRQITKSSPGKHIDYLSKALYWWQEAVKYIRHKRPQELVTTARALLSAYDAQRKGQASTSNKEKETYFIAALEAFRKYGDKLIVVDSVLPSIKLYKERNVKNKKVIQKLAPRFDPFLTLLSSCFASCPFTLKVLPDFNGDRSPARRVDHDLGKMIYTRQLALKLMKKHRAEGLLAVAVDEAMHISRAMAFAGMDKGAFIVDKDKQLSAYMQLMSDFVDFAKHHPDAPNRLIRSQVVKKKRPRKSGSEATVKINNPFDQSINSMLLDELQKEHSTLK